MKESDLRKWHRNLGIGLTLFIILQVGSGLLLTMNHISVPHSHTHGNEAGQEKSRETEKPALHDHSGNETIPRQLETSGAGISIRHDLYAHDRNAAEHAESHEAVTPLWIKCVQGIHHGGGSIGMVYRLLVGIGILGMAVSGVMIFLKIQARAKKG